MVFEKERAMNSHVSFGGRAFTKGFLDIASTSALHHHTPEDKGTPANSPTRNEIKRGRSAQANPKLNAEGSG